MGDTKVFSRISFDFQKGEQWGIKKQVTEPQCPICGDTGLILNEQNIAVPCKCWRQKQQQLKRKRARIQPALANMRFDNFELSFYPSNQLPEIGSKGNRGTYLDYAKAAKQQAQQFVRQITTDRNRKGLMLQGQIGSGKTHLAAAIANTLLDTNIDVLFLVVPDFLDELRASYGFQDEISELQIMDRAKNVPVLILDDLGTHNFSEWTQNKIFSLINYRLNQQLPTIITTNLDFQTLEGVLGPRVISRLVAGCEICLLPVPQDIRLLQSR